LPVWPLFLLLAVTRFFVNIPDIYSLLNDYYQDDLSTKEESRSTLKSADLLLEILLSYRLIFGQDKASRRAFRKEHRSSSTRKRLDEDQELMALCGHNWWKQQIYTEIDAPDAKTVYSGRTDFPFLAERLIILQDFVLTQSPNDWRTLWRDRRDMNRFWTLWAVVIFGAITIALSLIQIGLAIAQVVAAFK